MTFCESCVNLGKELLPLTNVKCCGFERGTTAHKVVIFYEEMHAHLPKKKISSCDDHHPQRPSLRPTIVSEQVFNIRFYVPIYG